MSLWIDPTKETVYILEAEKDLPPEQQTKWKFKPMSASCYAKFSDLILVADGKISNYGEYVLAALKYSLVGWEGKDCPPFVLGKDGLPTEETLSRIPHTIRWELGRAADNANKIDVETKKE